jgi:hypothetical protein
MKIIAIVFISVSVLLTPLPSSAAKGGEKGPADQAWEKANDKARFKRDEAGYGDMGEHQGKKQKGKGKDKYKDKERDRYDDDRDRDRDRDRHDDDRDRDRDRHDDDRDRDDRDRDRDRDRNDDRDDAKDKDTSTGDMEDRESGEQKRGRFWNRMKFWEQPPSE